MFLEDSEMIRAYQNGNTEAFEMLVRKYQRPLFTFLLRLVEVALQQLPEKQRRVFLLRQHGEMSFKEIAAQLGEPLNTVLSHMRYAVTKLRKQLRCVDV